ncbi:hypothetical protein ACTNBL_10890 [Enterococcus villorum]|jgi:hypothetical protein|uniref:Mga helix-turn-helix domain-containing protein n=2 Tax=Enterococcus villorum TaxID=112904 RepID=A0A511J0S0_9ENTE|nr:hypothetical protein [Enterococcus villorum]EOH86176.1 hypothetical protein UAO_02561 [Enterococcus villorum ATCC 700913]EOW78750.1 hypothetical protein I591_00293 [Enterococcus villorum ATCC 700913]GEL91616.1 hypothetical protein EVI01_09530 [Enterococcus villorum]
MNWQKLLSKNIQNLFILINQMKDLSWKKTDLAEKLLVDAKTIDRYLKRLEEGDFPIQLIQHKKNVQLIYNQGYSEPYLLFDFLIHSSSFCLLKDLILKNGYQQEYDRSSQERLRKWLGDYHLSFSYKKKKIYGSERKIRYLLFCFLKDFPVFFVDDPEQTFSELFIHLLEQRQPTTEVKILDENHTAFFEIFPELLFRYEYHLPIVEKNYRCIVRLSCNIIIEKYWEKIEQTQIYRKIMTLTEKLDSLFWLNSEFESTNKTTITRVIYQEWLRYSIGLHERVIKEEFYAYKESLRLVPNVNEKLYQYRMALQQTLTYPSFEWGLLLLKVLQERGYLEIYPPELKIVFFFRYDHEEARRLASVLDKTLRHRKRTSIHVCTRSTPPNYAQLIITDHFFPLSNSKNQKTYFYQASFGVDRLLSDIDYWIDTKN